MILKKALQWNIENINSYDYYKTFINQSNFDI